jgi:predicted 2-oxoglutarate/Fe(II)-dependent dioxygenase YbiX
MAVFKKFLEKDEVRQIKDWLEQDEEGWSTKAITGSSNPSIKHCQEYTGEFLGIIQNLIFKKLDENRSWIQYIAYPKTTSSIIINRYREGNFYREHLDINSNSGLGSFHYSSTLFISEITDYKNGELVLNRDEEDIFYKLPAGDLLTYPTGIPHKVEDITEGLRYSIVFWTESFIKEQKDRDLIRELFKGLDAFDAVTHGLHSTKQEDICKARRMFENIGEAIISKYDVFRYEKLYEKRSKT